MSMQTDAPIVGSIFNIQRFSTHDGPGIRTTVFLKGCPLRCFWCQNPESQKITPVLLFNSSLCTGCGHCVAECPQNALKIEDGICTIDRNSCQNCGHCVSACFQKGRTLAGRDITVDELMAVLLKDRFSYIDSGGGVTLSGGDPTLQWQFSLALLKACHEKHIDTAIETCGYTSWEILEPLAKECDFIFYDLKCIDPELHKSGTGVSNEIILENAKRLVEMGANVHFRTPLIPGFNDQEEHILALRNYVLTVLHLSTDRLELLKYNKLGEDKFLRIGCPDNQPQLEPQSDEYIAHLNSILNQ